MSNFLVTGGAGFIGSKLSSRLIDQGHNVFILDNLSTGYESNIPAKATFEKGSVFGDDIQKYKNVNFEAIFHIAGQSSGEISFSDPFYDIRTNAESTLNLLKFSIDNKCQKFIYASTMSVYGSVEDRAINEMATTHPLSFYGVGKLASENYIRIYNQTYGIKGSALRLFNVYGPGQNLSNMKQGMISIFMAYLLKSQPIHIKGSGERFRDFIYVDDVVDAFIAQIDHIGAFSLLNIGSGKKTYIKDLVIKIIEAMGFDPKTYEYFFQDNTPGDQFGIYADITQATKKLNWKPKIQLEEGLQKMASWAKNQK